jgi:hypothetical protein
MDIAMSGLEVSFRKAHVLVLPLPTVVYHLASWRRKGDLPSDLPTANTQTSKLSRVIIAVNAALQREAIDTSQLLTCDLEGFRILARSEPHKEYLSRTIWISKTANCKGADAELFTPHGFNKARESVSNELAGMLNRDTFAEFFGLLVYPAFLDRPWNGYFMSDRSLTSDKLDQAESLQYPKTFQPINFTKPYKIIKAALGRELKPDDYSFEITASFYEGRRAIYASALGFDDSSDVKAAEEINTEDACEQPRRTSFVILHASADQFQVGRLSLAILRCGENRIASTRGIKSLKEIGDYIEKYESKLADHRFGSKPSERSNEPGERSNEPSERSNEPSERSNEPSERSNEPSERSNELALRSTYKSVREAVHHITNSRVEYRIIRNRTYWSRFNRIVAELNPETVPDFEPYPRFVARRLAGKVDFFDSLARRIRVLAADVDRLVELEEATALTNIQKVAEVWFVVPLMYYVYYACKHFLPSLLDPGMSSSIAKYIALTTGLCYVLRPLLRREHSRSAWIICGVISVCLAVNLFLFFWTGAFRKFFSDLTAC